RAGHVGGELRAVQLEMAHDAMQVGILRLQDLLQPMLELHVRIAAQLAEYCRALDRLVGERVELAEQGDAADLAHGFLTVLARRQGELGSSARAPLRGPAPGPALRPACRAGRPMSSIRGGHSGLAGSWAPEGSPARAARPSETRNPDRCAPSRP